MENKYFVCRYDRMFGYDGVFGPYNFKQAVQYQQKSIEDNLPVVIMKLIVDEHGREVI